MILDKMKRVGMDSRQKEDDGYKIGDMEKESGRSVGYEIREEETRRGRKRKGRKRKRSSKRVEEKEKEEEEYCVPHSDCEDYPEDGDPVLKCITSNDPDGLMSALKFPKDKKGWNVQLALYWACTLDKLDCVKVLLDSGGADLLRTCEHGDTPLHGASMGDSKNVAEHLFAVAEEKQIGFDKLLGAVNLSSRTPLHAAVRCGSCDVMSVLLHHGANPFQLTGGERAPIQLAHPGTIAWRLMMDAAPKIFSSKSKK